MVMAATPARETFRSQALDRPEERLRLARSSTNASGSSSPKARLDPLIIQACSIRAGLAFASVSAQTRSFQSLARCEMASSSRAAAHRGKSEGGLKIRSASRPTQAGVGRSGRHLPPGLEDHVPDAAIATAQVKWRCFSRTSQAGRDLRKLGGSLRRKRCWRNAGSRAGVDRARVKPPRSAAGYLSSGGPEPRFEKGGLRLPGFHWSRPV